MALKVGINGLGRIGRELVYQILTDSSNEIELVAVNDENISSVDDVLYFLTYNSTNLGRRTNCKFEKASDGTDYFSAFDSNLKPLNGGSPIVYFNKSVSELTWDSVGAQVVIDCTGSTDVTNYLKYHIDNGAKYVFYCGLNYIDTTGTILVPGVHTVDNIYLPSNDPYIALGDPVTQATAGILKLLQDNIGITAVNGTIIQAYTNEQALLDGPKINVSLENCRAAAENITPKTISKAALNRVIPELNGKILAYNAFRVPVAQGAAFNLVIKVDNPSYTVDSIKLLFNDNLDVYNAHYSNIKITNYGQYLTSSDVIGKTYTATILPHYISKSTLNGESYFSLVGLYDNESGYVAQIVRALILFNTIQNN